MNKNCFKCGVNKPLDCFYPHKMMADGYLNKCKECTKADVKQHRAGNLEKVRAYDVARSKTPARRELNARITRAWREADKDRSSAHNAVSYAVRTGVLVAQACPCGCTKTVAHHESYAKEDWLKVVWLCQSCHKRRHAQINSERKAA
jgi:hypothetical protein